MCAMQFSFKGSHSDSQMDVVIRPGLLDELDGTVRELARSGCCFVVSDSNVSPLYGIKVLGALERIGFRVFNHVVLAGEGSKSWAEAGRIHAELAKAKILRDGVIIAVGGGVVGDLAGFVAATWMRGVTWVNCPTSMEAVIDACFGGKTAVNLPEGKNLVGTFHHPKAVLIDPNTLCTLPDRDVRAGLAEAIKHAALQSKIELEWLAASAKSILALEADTLAELIERNLRFKASVVEADPDERVGKRIMLNLGHTIGHVIELLAEGQLRHGECVALGMLAEGWIAEQLGVMRGDDLGRIQGVIECLGLSGKLELAIDPQEVWNSIQLDKKNTTAVVRMVLLEGIGKPVVRDDIEREMIVKAVQSLS